MLNMHRSLYSIYTQNSRCTITKLSILCTHRTLDPIDSQILRSYIFTILSIRYIPQNSRCIDSQHLQSGIFTDFSIAYTHRILDPMLSQNSRSILDPICLQNALLYLYSYRTLESIYSQNFVNRSLKELSIQYTHRLLGPIYSQTSRSYILTELSIRYTHRTIDLYTHRTLTELSILCTPKHSETSRSHTFIKLSIL